jgi:hypothetical protein
LAAAAGGLAGAHPTGTRVTDIVLSAVASGVVAFATGYAKRWSWLVLATASVLVASGAVGWCLGGAALALTLLAIVANVRSRLLGELVGVLAVSALVLDGSEMPLRFSAAVGVCACAAVIASAYASAPRGIRRLARRTLAVAGTVVAAGVILFLVAAASARTSLDEALASVEQGIGAARVGNRDQTIEALHRAGDALRRARADTDSALVKPALSLPGLGPNIAALNSAIDEGIRLTDTALATALQVDPELLRPLGGVVDLSSVEASQVPLSRVVAALEQARDRLRSNNSPWLVSPVAHRLAAVRDRIDQFLPEARNARDAAASAPRLLGADAPRRYLVLFVTPVEARGSGFPGNFAELLVSGGRMSLERFGRGSELIAKPGSPPRTISGPADFLARYSRFDPAAGFIDVASTPDLPTVAEVYRQLYPQAGGNAIDGVIRVDPVGLAALLRYTGPIAVASAPVALTADNAANYLLKDQYLAFPTEASKRIDVLDDLGHATFDRLTKVDLPSPQQLAHDLGPMVEGQHLSMTTFDPAAEQVLDRVGLSGAVPTVDGDQIGVIINDIGGSKIDLFLERDLDYHAKWDPATGSIDAAVTVTLRNTAPASGLPDVVIGNVVAGNTPDREVLPEGTNRAFVSIYSPWFPMSPKVDGVDTPFQIEDELGRKVASVTVDIPAGGTKTLTLEFHGKVPIGESYHLDIWRQTLVLAGNASVHIDTSSGRKLDKQLSLDANGSISLRAG